MSDHDTCVHWSQPCGDGCPAPAETAIETAVRVARETYPPVRVNLTLGPDVPEYCPVCGIHASRHYAIKREYWPDLTDAERDAVLAHEGRERAESTKDGTDGQR